MPRRKVSRSEDFRHLYESREVGLLPAPSPSAGLRERLDKFPVWNSLQRSHTDVKIRLPTLKGILFEEGLDHESAIKRGYSRHYIIGTGLKNSKGKGISKHILGSTSFPSFIHTNPTRNLPEKAGNKRRDSSLGSMFDFSSDTSSNEDEDDDSNSLVTIQRDIHEMGNQTLPLKKNSSEEEHSKSLPQVENLTSTLTENDAKLFPAEETESDLPLLKSNNSRTINPEDQLFKSPNNPPSQTSKLQTPSTKQTIQDTTQDPSLLPEIKRSSSHSVFLTENTDGDETKEDRNTLTPEMIQTHLPSLGQSVAALAPTMTRRRVIPTSVFNVFDGVSRIYSMRILPCSVHTSRTQSMFQDDWHTNRHLEMDKDSKSFVVPQVSYVPPFLRVPRAKHIKS